VVGYGKLWVEHQATAFVPQERKNEIKKEEIKIEFSLIHLVFVAGV